MRRIKQSLPKNEKVQIHSKGFQSVFRSILLMIPLSVMLIVIAELVSLFSMERMADNFEHQTGIRVLNQVDQTFQQAYRVLMKMKMDENFTDYIKKLERDYYDEAVIYQQLLKQQSGYNNIEEVALYFPQYEYVLSSVYGGKESEIYQRASYACSFDKWKHTLDSEWKNGFQILPGTAGENKNLISAMISSNSGNQNYAHIFVQLDNSFLLDILSGLSLRGGEEAFICTENGMAASTLEDVEDELARKLMECQEKGVKNLKIGDITYRFRFISSDHNSLMLAYATPKGAGYEALNFVKICGVSVSITGMLALFALAFYVAKKNYYPIQFLLNMVRDTDKTKALVMDDLSDLTVYMEKSIQARKEMDEKLSLYETGMRELQLGQLLFWGSGNAEDPVPVLTGFEDKYYAVMMSVFEEDEEELKADLEADRKDILKGYIQECFSKITGFYVLEGRDGFFTIFSGNGVSAEEFRQRLSDQREQMKQLMAEKEKIFCNCYLSDGMDSIARLHEGYEQVKQKYVNKEVQDKTDDNENCTIDRIVELIRENFSDENLSVNGLADSLGVTPSHLSRYFKHKMGMGVLEYIHRCRVEAAAAMLRDCPEIKIREVAERAGFTNMTTFIRVFKKNQGVTPGQYRETLEETKI